MNTPSPRAIAALRMKQSTAYASIKKVKTMLACAGPGDNRIRGLLNHHGATTGRWTASLVQFQNMKRPTIANSEDAYRDICNGVSREMLEICYGSVLEVISSCIRHFVHNCYVVLDENREHIHSGKNSWGVTFGETPFLDVDYSAIEARIVAWLADEQKVLAQYRAYDAATTPEAKNAIDPYRILAASIYGIALSDVQKFPHRLVGKHARLGCIAEGELVLTDCGLVPIEQIKCWHRLWDGVEWVHHEGLIYQGHKEVITYQGLSATPEHQVFVHTGLGLERTTDLWTARKQELRLVLSADAGAPVRTMDASNRPSVSGREWLPPHESGMRVWDYRFSGLQHAIEETEPGLRSVRPQRPEVSPRPGVVGVTFGSSQGTLRELMESCLPMVRGPGDSLSFQVSDPRSELDHGQPWPEASFDLGPQGQRRALRTGEHEVCYTAGAEFELQCEEDRLHLPPRRMALLSSGCREVLAKRYEQGTDFGTSGASSAGETQKVAYNPSAARTVATFDILNAGPRHRFTVSGKLVHNCGYGMGAPKFRDTVKKQGRYDLPPGMELRAVKTYRRENRKIVSLWYDLEKAAKQAILHKGKVFAVRHLSFKCFETGGTMFLFMRLPSGRKLAYPRPRISNDRITYFGNIEGAKWGDVSIWGGTFCENSCQAIAGDILFNGIHKSEAAGYETVTLVHDQLISFWKEGQTVEELIRLLTDLPDWANGLPIAAEGELAPFYRKS